MKLVKISNLEAAKRQLDVAIKLFFQSEDDIAIHSLTANSHEILSVSAKKQGKKSLIYDDAMQDLTNTERKEFGNRIRLRQNTFKHPTGKEIIYNVEQTRYLLFDCCILYFRITGELTSLHYIYKIWFHANYLEVSIGDAKKKALELHEGLDLNDRIKLFNSLPNIQKLLKARGINLFS